MNGTGTSAGEGRWRASHDAFVPCADARVAGVAALTGVPVLVAGAEGTPGAAGVAGGTTGVEVGRLAL